MCGREMEFHLAPDSHVIRILAGKADEAKFSTQWSGLTSNPLLIHGSTGIDSCMIRRMAYMERDASIKR